MSLRRAHIGWLVFGVFTQFVQLVLGDGLGGTNESAICVQTEREIQQLTINTDQAKDGVEGGVIVANACKQLVSANVMMYRSEADQKALCDNECFPILTAKYQILLENNCFASSDSDETASSNLQAIAYQFACQTTVKGKYCVPMLANLVANAATGYDLCKDIVDDMGCCFQSYKQYVQYGTPAAIKAADTIEQTCRKNGATGIDKVCPCGPNNLYNKQAIDGTTICSHAAQWGLVTLVLLVAMASYLLTG